MCCNGFSRKINLFKYKSHFKGYSKHELSTINMSSVSEKNYRITSLPHHLSTTATFLRPQGGRCREVRLCSVRTPKQLLLFIATAITLTFHREQILQTSDYNFFRERKAHVMTPHNTGLTGGRDDLPLRFRARTFPQLLQYCLRLETWNWFPHRLFYSPPSSWLYKWRLLTARATVAKFITYKLISTRFQTVQPLNRSP